LRHIRRKGDAMLGEFDVVGGSIPGVDHTMPGKPGWKNNHDAFLWHRAPDFTVAVVCDGCGSGAHSEIGAKIGARLIVTNVSHYVQRYIEQSAESPDEYPLFPYWDRVRMHILSQISVLAHAMGGSFSQVISDYFLFTVVGALITPRKTFIFSIGDGMYLINGKGSSFGPFPNNEPPYLTYEIVGSSIAETHSHLLRFREESCDTDQVESVLIGTDGAEDLWEIDEKGQTFSKTEGVASLLHHFITEERYMRNPDMIRRKLASLNVERALAHPTSGKPMIKPGLLHDDTTLIVVRRKKSETDEPKEEA